MSSELSPCASEAGHFRTPRKKGGSSLELEFFGGGWTVELLQFTKNIKMSF